MTEKVASVLSPVLVPLAFLVLGVGVVSWYLQLA